MFTKFRHGYPYTLSLIILILGFSTGCASLPSAPSQKAVSPEARHLIENLHQTTSSAIQFKGLGTYQLINASGKLSGRMAWACIYPNQFRADILDISGRPMATLTSDGSRIYTRINNKEKIYSHINNKRVLKRIIGFPVTIRELTTYLSGSVPVNEYSQARVVSADPHRQTLILEDHADRLIQKIVFDEGAPKKAIVFNTLSQEVYKVHLGLPVWQNEHVFFKTLSFKSPNENRFDLRLDKLWLDNDLPSSIFKLQPPQS